MSTISTILATLMISTANYEIISIRI